MKEDDQKSPKLFEDILDDAPIASLNIEEKEFTPFNPADAASANLSGAQEREETQPAAQKKVLKRTARHRVEKPVQEEAATEENVVITRPKTGSNEALTWSKALAKSMEDEQTETVSASSVAVEVGEESTEEPVQTMAEASALLQGTLHQPAIQSLRQSAKERAEQAAKQTEVPETEEEDEEEEEVVDQEALATDDTDYDLFMAKKRYLLSDYKKIEDYLAEQSRQGFHYDHHEGKKYYFHKGEPKNYYYKILYFQSEPVPSQWKLWQEQGWEGINHAPSRKKKDSGWYFLRHEDEEGEYHRDIENEEEKYRYFTKFANSCRSTLFLLFICIACSVVTAYLQYVFQGYWIFFILCVGLGVIALWVFLIYLRMFRKAKKQANLLAARLRLSEKTLSELAGRDQTDKDLDSDWEQIDEQEEEAKPKGKKAKDANKKDAASRNKKNGDDDGNMEVVSDRAEKV